MPMTRQIFGRTPEGVEIERYTLTNASGLAAEIMTLGATWMVLRTPDRAGRPGDVLLGFDTLEGYLAGHPYFGSVVGRYGNRIARGRFTLDGVTYQLPINNGPNHLHGGPQGFHTRVWAARPLDSAGEPALELRYLSRDGEEGYPGNLTATVVYTLTGQNELRIDYHATTDRPTVVNLTNHAYFNLAGGGDVLGHVLELAASRFIPVDATSIPLGELRPVAGTPMDFTAPTAIGARIGADDEQLRLAGGYDHTWVFDRPAGATGVVGRLYEPGSGRLVELETTQPGVQFYSGNYLDGTISGKGGQVYGHRAGLCLETQHFPDSPNQPQFPSTVLRPGETYRQTTVYRFGTK
ncbi:MAG TPA: aldose epimerase family protein [Roseiflexaceae bacterium]|nr:aldose epimerase family protein [Roseiflexaceae bacterium]